MRWIYGVTTVLSRRENLLPRTLDSLCNAGFPKPRLFVDGCSKPELYNFLGLEVTIRQPPIRTVANWILTLWELYLREPHADRYAVFQDDFVTYNNLRQYLENCKYPEKGYWNLYTFPMNQAKAPKDDKPCWFLSNQLGKGAVALVFNRPAVETLLLHPHLFRKSQTNKGYKSVDGSIVTSFKFAGWKEYCHNPSLVQHTGDKSSMGNRVHQKAASFKGEDFDAMELLTLRSENA